jgi:hypothetical protein
MTMHINHEKWPCSVCRRPISRPNYVRHIEACERNNPDLAKLNREEVDRDYALFGWKRKGLGEG